MSNAANVGQQALPDVKTLIRPETIRAMTRFPDEQKREAYIAGVTELWEKLNNNSPDSEEYKKAHNRLCEVTRNVRMTMMKLNGAAAAAQQNGVRPPSSGQPAQPDGRPPGANAEGGSQPQKEQISQAVIDEVRKLRLVAPTNLSGNPEAARQWISSAQKKYAENLHRLEQASKRLIQMNHVVTVRNQSGKPLDAEETKRFKEQVAGHEATQRDTKLALQQFQAQQDNYKAQLAQGSGGNGVATTSMPTQTPHTSAQNPYPMTSSISQPQVKQEPQGQAHTISSAVDAARNHASATAGSAMSPHTSGQPSQPPMHQPPTQRVPPGQNSLSHSHPQLNLNTASSNQNQQHNSPRGLPPHSSNVPHEPVPLSHSAAVDAARSYSQPHIPQQTPQSAGHGPSSDQRNQNNHTKMPIPKDLNLPPIQPVALGPSRPTLTNGPVAMGPIGQPAIQKHPGYVLEGEGERVLSKKKLEELVRQVTGGTGGEAEEGEGLTAEVEEVCISFLIVLIYYFGQVSITNIGPRHCSKSPTSSSIKS